MPRSAPVPGTDPVNYTEYSCRMIDTVGDLRTVTIRTPADTVTDAEFEAWIAALAADTNADIYSVTKKNVWNAVAQASNATNAPRVSVDDNIVLLFKDTLNNSINTYIPAPDDANFVSGTENPDPAQIGTTVTTALAVANGGAAGSGAYTARTARFTERREINETVEI